MTTNGKICFAETSSVEIAHLMLNKKNKKTFQFIGKI